MSRKPWPGLGACHPLPEHGGRGGQPPSLLQVIYKVFSGESGAQPSRDCSLRDAINDLGSAAPPQPSRAPGGKTGTGSWGQRGLWGCPDAPAHGLSPQPACEPRQASPVVGTGGRTPGRGRRTWPGTLDRTSLARQYNCPAPSQTKLTDRQAREDSSHPRTPRWLLPPLSLCVLLATSANSPAIYIALQRECKLQASPSSAPGSTLITSSAGRRLPARAPWLGHINSCP